MLPVFSFVSFSGNHYSLNILAVFIFFLTFFTCPRCSSRQSNNILPPFSNVISHFFFPITIILDITLYLELSGTSLHHIQCPFVRFNHACLLFYTNFYAFPIISCLLLFFLIITCPRCSSRQISYIPPPYIYTHFIKYFTYY